MKVLPPIATRHLYWMAGLLVFASTSLAMLTWAQIPAPLNIVTPGDGSSALPGTNLAISINVASGTYPQGVSAGGPLPLGFSAPKPVVGSTVSLSLAIPTDTPPGSYAIAAFASDSTGAVVTSAPVTVNVERTGVPTALSILPTAAIFKSIGDTLHWRALATFSGKPIDVTNSSQLVVTSENPNVATAHNGLFLAVGAGKTNIDVTYGSKTQKIAVTVPDFIPGDINQDGFVNCADIAIIKASLGTQFGQAGFDPRADVNGDGVVNMTDLSAETALLPAGTVCN
jgi:Dockerin type I domain